MNRIHDELKWIDLVRKGDADAFCRLYGLYRVRLYRYAFYRLGNAADAEDAVSECVLSAWKQIESLREAEAFPTWIFRILSACCGKLIQQQIEQRQEVPLEDAEARNKGRSTVPPSGAMRNEEPSSVSRGDVLFVAEDKDLNLILQEALAQISPEERNIVLLSAVGGLKSREIAELTGLTPGSVRSSLSRSLKKVRGFLE